MHQHAQGVHMYWSIVESYLSTGIDVVLLNLRTTACTACTAAEGSVVLGYAWFFPPL
jgi:hypothetical protein